MRFEKLIMGLFPILLFVGVSCLTSLRRTPLCLSDFFLIFESPNICLALSHGGDIAKKITGGVGFVLLLPRPLCLSFPKADRILTTELFEFQHRVSPKR